jgi:hypothetical protein
VLFRVVVSLHERDAGHDRPIVHDDDLGVLDHLPVDIDDLGRTRSLRHDQPDRFHLGK